MRLKSITGILTGHCLLLSSGRMYYEDATDSDLGEETPQGVLCRHRQKGRESESAPDQKGTNPKYEDNPSDSEFLSGYGFG